MGAVSRLKFVVCQCFFVANSHADKAICSTGFNGELLCFNDLDDLDIVSCEGKMGEVVGIVLNQVFGNGVDICHKRCPGSEG